MTGLVIVWVVFAIVIVGWVSLIYYAHAFGVHAPSVVGAHSDLLERYDKLYRVHSAAKFSCAGWAAYGESRKVIREAQYRELKGMESVQ